MPGPILSIYVNSFNSLQQSLRDFIIFYPHFTYVETDTEGVNNLPKVTQLLNGRTGIKTGWLALQPLLITIL